MWRFDDVIARTHDASGFDTDDDEDEADRAVGSTAPITQRDRHDVDWTTLTALVDRQWRLRGSCTPHVK